MILCRFFDDSWTILKRFFDDSWIIFGWFFADSSMILRRFLNDSWTIFERFFAISSTILRWFFDDFSTIFYQFLHDFSRFFTILEWFFADSWTILGRFLDDSSTKKNSKTSIPMYNYISWYNCYYFALLNISLHPFHPFLIVLVLHLLFNEENLPRTIIQSLSSLSPLKFPLPDLLKISRPEQFPIAEGDVRICIKLPR